MTLMLRSEDFSARNRKQHLTVFSKNLSIAKITIVSILLDNMQEMKECMVLVVRVTVTNLYVALTFSSNRLLFVEQREYHQRLERSNLFTQTPSNSYKGFSLKYSLLSGKSSYRLRTHLSNRTRH